MSEGLLRGEASFKISVDEIFSAIRLTGHRAGLGDAKISDVPYPTSAGGRFCHHLVNDLQRFMPEQDGVRIYRRLRLPV